MKHYYIQSLETCPQCDGHNYVRNSAWDAVDEYVSGLPDNLKSRERDEAIEAFCVEHFGYQDPRHWPAEDNLCPSCGGSGLRVEENDVTELIYALKSLPETIARIIKRIKAIESPEPEDGSYAEYRHRYFGESAT